MERLSPSGTGELAGPAACQAAIAFGKTCFTKRRCISGVGRREAVDPLQGQALLSGPLCKLRKGAQCDKSRSGIIEQRQGLNPAPAALDIEHGRTIDDHHICTSRALQAAARIGLAAIRVAIEIAYWTAGLSPWNDSKPGCFETVSFVAADLWDCKD